MDYPALLTAIADAHHRHCRRASPAKRASYENECLKAKGSVRQLQRHVGSLLFERADLSTDEAAVIARARERATDTPGTSADLIRDPNAYVFEFTGLAEPLSKRMISFDRLTPNPKAHPTRSAPNSTSSTPRATIRPSASSWITPGPTNSSAHRLLHPLRLPS
jgi:hypothetical protein